MKNLKKEKLELLNKVHNFVVADLACMFPEDIGYGENSDKSHLEEEAKKILWCIKWAIYYVIMDIKIASELEIKIDYASLFEKLRSYIDTIHETIEYECPLKEKCRREIETLIAKLNDSPPPLIHNRHNLPLISLD